MTDAPSSDALDAIIARFERDKTIDEALVRSLAEDRALRDAWVGALKRRLAALITSTKQARDTAATNTSELEQRLSIEKDALRTLVQSVDARLRASAPMPCLKIRTRVVDDDDD